MTGLDRKKYIPVAAFSKDGPLAERLPSENIPSFVLKKRGFLGIGLLWEAVALLKDEKVDLVHLNSAVPFCKYIGIAAKIKNIPVIWHIREDPEGKRVKTLKIWISLLSDRIFVVSSDLELYFKDTGKAMKIYNGVDIEKFRPGMDGSAFRARYGIPPDAFVFGMVGSIEKRKGNIPFLEAARAISSISEKSWFVIVGSGLGPDVNEVESFIKENGLDGRVVLTGRLSDIPEAMAGIDVLVMPSLWEGFPRALIEAMASGKPSIASAVGEVRQIIEDGKTGFIIPKGDITALTNAMKRCIGMGDELAAAGDAARKMVAGFTIAKHLEAVQNEYKKILG
jgi:glycosyltransferase involved in cell wall biosynthesis